MAHGDVLVLLTASHPAACVSTIAIHVMLSRFGMGVQAPRPIWESAAVTASVRDTEYVTATETVSVAVAASVISTSASTKLLTRSVAADVSVISTPTTMEAV